MSDDGWVKGEYDEYVKISGLSKIWSMPEREFEHWKNEMLASSKPVLRIAKSLRIPTDDIFAFLGRSSEGDSK